MQFVTKKYFLFSYNFLCRRKFKTYLSDIRAMSLFAYPKDKIWGFPSEIMINFRKSIKYNNNTIIIKRVYKVMNAKENCKQINQWQALSTIINHWLKITNLINHRWQLTLHRQSLPSRRPSAGGGTRSTTAGIPGSNACNKVIRFDLKRATKPNTGA